MQLDTEDTACLEKLGFIVEPALLADKKAALNKSSKIPLSIWKISVFGA